MDEPSVRLYQPLRTNKLSPLLASWSFGRRGFQQIKWSTLKAGGMGEATIVAPAYFHGLTLLDLIDGRSDIRPWAHVEIWVGGQQVWEGMLNGYRLDGLSIVGFTGIGYGLGLRHTPFAGASGNALDVLKAMIRDEAPFMRLGPTSRVLDPQYTLESSQVENLYFNDLINLLNKNGSARGYPFRCQVWPGRVITLEADVPPEVPQWRIPEVGLTIQEPDIERLVGQVTAVSGTTAVTTTEDATFQGRYGVRRVQVIDVGSNASISQLTAYANAYQAANSRVRLNASWSGDEWLPTMGGTRLPAWAAIAGVDWAEVPMIGVQQIVKSEVSFPEWTVQLSLGALDLDERWLSSQQEIQASIYRQLRPTSWVNG